MLTPYIINVKPSAKTQPANLGREGRPINHSCALLPAILLPGNKPGLGKIVKTLASSNSLLGTMPCLKGRLGEGWGFLSWWGWGRMVFGGEPDGSVENKTFTVPLSKGYPFTYDPVLCAFGAQRPDGCRMPLHVKGDFL